MIYKLSRFGHILRTADNLSIPIEPANLDYQKYLAWLALGNVPDPADPAPTPIDQSDLDLINKQMKALALMLRTYTNQTRSGVTTQISAAQVKADFKTAFDSLP